ncbi:2-polyprenyl-6-methoxyphenol hydroxylase-like FAD-dependent oxidoreductase [Spinactinospora alkalitolerans]|uniref:2-polyprenyl-6-methoxyphenol hydroxylase-like FAD-dependent oxidoreductase n=1 Tax=Spinactinospora alkalitolerans TaxID=687207 RepID=A0A852TTZ5_9ACTN|nr:FAD-dependent monooxygenase [Spinactinospora alkalitolerans]NYE45410.1 2-polyprenyl-6-methoxyphenol hydroxylase-like FAD-dependent oxidoreductase [Spinactinospora alkalitolerans]
MTTAPEVLIAGAGPSGLLCAVELARRGIHCRILDARPGGPHVQTRCPTLWQRSLEVLSWAGVEVDRAEGLLPLRHKVFHIGGESAAVGVSAPDAPFPEPVLLAQSRLERLLTERLAALGTLVEYGWEVLDAVDRGDGVDVVVRGPSGTTRTAAGWLVNASGRSGPPALSTGAGAAVQRGYQGTEWVLADVRVGGAGLPADEEHIYRLEAGHAGLIPVSGGVHRLFLGVEGGATPSARAVADTAAAITGLRIAPVPGTLWRTRPEGIVTDIRRSRRVLLVGDAAKRFPMPVHGLNSGLQDAFSLGWMLAGAIRDGDEGLPAEYAAERRAAALALFERTDRIFGYGSAVDIATLRGRLLARVVDMRTEPAVRHPPGRLVSDGAGEPLPAVPVRGAGPQGLFGLVRGAAEWSAVLLAAPEDHAAAETARILRRRLASRFPGRVRLLTAAPSGARRPGGLMLVRPDGHVAWRGEAAEQEGLLGFLAGALRPGR